MPHLFQGHVIFFWWFLGCKNLKVNKTLTTFTNFQSICTHMYSKGHNSIQTMSHPFKESVTIFGCFGEKNIVKTEYNLKNISKYGKNRLTNNFVKTLSMYFQ